MDKKTDQRETPGTEQPENRRGNNSLLIAIIIAALVVLLFYNRQEERSGISASFFQTELDKGNIEEVGIAERRVYGKFVTRPEIPECKGQLDTGSRRDTSEENQYSEKFVFNRPNDAGWVTQLESQLKLQNVRYSYLEPDNTQQVICSLPDWSAPRNLFFLFMMLRRTRSDIMGGRFLSGFSKSPAKRFEASEKMVTFKDVAGLEGVKADLEEIVEFLKTPDKFQKLGGRVPKEITVMVLLAQEKHY